MNGSQIRKGGGGGGRGGDDDCGRGTTSAARLTQKDVKFMNMNEPPPLAAIAGRPHAALTWHGGNETGPNVINTSDPDMRAGSI